MGDHYPAPHAPSPEGQTTNPHATVRKRNTPKSPARATNHTADPPARIVVPVRYATWLLGDLGERLERTLEDSLDQLDEIHVSRLPRAFLVEARESPGPFLEAVHRATMDLEKGIETRYPVFHHQLGPLWTGTLQSVFA